MGTLKELRDEMKADKELVALMVPSGRNELFIDLDDDKVADIALIDNNQDGDIDTLAIDITGNGEFNFYASDKNGNGIIDTVELYEDGEDMPIVSHFGKAVEDHFIELAETAYAHIIAEEIMSDELIRAFATFEKLAEEEYKKAEKEKATKQ